MEHKITVVGIGPGGPDYLLPIARKKIEAAAVLLGSRRALDAYGTAAQQTKVIDGDLAGVMGYIQEKREKAEVVVMVSGDPGCYSLLPAIRRSFPQVEIEVIPGISSFQMAFARIGEVWQDADLISLHGREVEPNNLKFCPGRKVAFLTDAIHRPAYIAELLCRFGWPAQSQAYLCERLSYEQEKVGKFTLEEAKTVAGFEHSVMVVKA